MKALCGVTVIPDFRQGSQSLGPFYKGGNGGSERWSELFKIRGGPQSQVLDDTPGI